MTIYKHVKRGTEYELIGIGKMQAEGWLITSTINWESTSARNVDMQEVAVYRSVTDPTEIWVRPRGEFEDGRFIRVEIKEPRAQGDVSVKRLEWLPDGDNGFVATAVFGEYEINPVGFLDQEQWELLIPAEHLGHFDTVEEAKAAAEADYRTRILSALETEAVAECATEGCERPATQAIRPALSSESKDIEALIPVQPLVFALSETEGVLFDPQGKFHGWLMRKHPDGMWISIRKLAAVDPEADLPVFLRSLNQEEQCKPTT